MIVGPQWKETLHHRGHLAMSEDIFGYQIWGMLMAASGERLGMMLRMMLSLTRHRIVSQQRII
jgi:hypothetical protein